MRAFFLVFYTVEYCVYGYKTSPFKIKMQSFYLPFVLLVGLLTCSSLLSFEGVSCDLGPSYFYQYTPYNITIRLERDNHPKREGRMFVTLLSNSTNSTMSPVEPKEFDLTPGTIVMKAGRGYSFFVSSSKDISNITGISFRWASQSTRFGRLFSSSHPDLHISYIEVRPLETQSLKFNRVNGNFNKTSFRFCGQSQPMIVREKLRYVFDRVC